MPTGYAMNIRHGNLDQDDQAVETMEVTGDNEIQLEEKAGFKVRYTP